MICSSCGKDIPFSGTVCPYCQCDKSGDQSTQLLAFALGASGATIGYLVDGFGYAIAGLFVGAVVGAAVGTARQANLRVMGPTSYQAAPPRCAVGYPGLGAMQVRRHG